MAVQDLKRGIRQGPTADPVTEYAPFGRRLSAMRRPDSLQRLGPMVHAAGGWLGYDDVGRSLLYRILLGLPVSLGIGLGAAFLSVGIGVFWGSFAALMGGRTDALMMRIVDILYGLPYILFVILLKVVLEKPLVAFFGGRTAPANIVMLFLAIGSVSWLTMARVIRGQVLSLRRRPFIEAARAEGLGAFAILRRHLLPNLVGPITVYATLIIPQAILQEAFLSFLGLGVRAPTPSLGTLAAEGVEAINTFVGFWWLLAFPCGLLAAILLALNFVGDGLRDALDPSSQAAQMI